MTRARRLPTRTSLPVKAVAPIPRLRDPPSFNKALRRAYGIPPSAPGNGVMSRPGG
jgi:AraC-like DNA-binding protein